MAETAASTAETAALTSETAAPAPDRSFLWLTSRSTHERGSAFCAFARYVEYHAGPFGYGFSRKAMSLPLVTGTYAHLGITSVLQWIIDARQETGVQPESVPDDVVRWAAEVAVEEYQSVCQKRGILTYAQDNEETLAKLQFLIKEQSWLIEGLTWAWCLTRLPIYLRDYTIIAQEEEEEYVIECTCGLGDGIGTFEEHERRGCGGIGFMSKPDFLGERKSDGEYGYIEFKTSSVANKGLNESWERKPQFILSMLGAERRHGVRISHAWVETLVKGDRDRQAPYTADLPKLQQSVFCCAYYGAPNPPLAEGEWKPAYNYIDSLGEKHTISKKLHKKVQLWDPPLAEAWAGKPEEMSVVEYWAKVLQTDYPAHLEKVINPIGPIPRRDDMVEKAIRAVRAEENLWRERLWKLYEFQQESGKGWGDDQFHEFLELVVPRSWKCDPWADHPCPNQPICHPQTEDWRQPIESELFVYRSPHHLAEVEQMKARGLEPPPEGLGVEDGEQDDE